CYDCITQQTVLNHLRECLIINKAWPAEVQPVSSTSTITYQVEAQLSICTFNSMIHLARQYFDLTHYHLKVVYQGFHLSIYILLWRQVIPVRLFCIEYILLLRVILFYLRYFTDGLLHNAQALPYLQVAHQIAVIYITGSAGRYLKV